MMLRLTFLLSGALFLTLLIGGQDYGQLRPGLAAARQDEQAGALSAADSAPKPVSDLVVAGFTPETEASSSAPELASPVLALPLITAEPVTEAVAEDATEVAAEPVVEGEPANVWYVTGTTVNVREGPGTDYAVLEKLVRGDAATLVWSDDTGWAIILI
jgi:hypothetical protein